MPGCAPQLPGERLGYRARRPAGGLGQSQRPPPPTLVAVVARARGSGRSTTTSSGTGTASTAALDGGRHGGPDDVAQLLGCPPHERTDRVPAPRAALHTSAAPGEPRAPRGRPGPAHLGLGPATPPRAVAARSGRCPRGQGRTSTGTPSTEEPSTQRRGLGQGPQARARPHARRSQPAGRGRRQGRAHPSAGDQRRRPQRPWGLIAAAVVVVLFAAAVLTYAVLQVNEAEEGRVDASTRSAACRPSTTPPARST
jgi:hypothetical protein